MKVHTDLQHFPRVKFPVITIGTFDGVHLGHGKILEEVSRVARMNNGESVVFTFFPHPRMVLFPHDTRLKLLSSQREKIARIESYGIDHLIVFPFTREFSRLTAVEFVREILVNQLGMKKLVIGYDHHFGRNREGSIDNLRELGPLYGFETEEIPAHLVDESVISSTKIRHALAEGDMETATRFLGYIFPFTGMVIRGNQRGRTLGYPTANLNPVEPYKLIPGNGVYVVTAEHKNQTYPGMMNIGHRPTVDDSGNTQMEVHLFDMSADLYGELLTIHFHHKLRDEIKFSSPDQLKNQLGIDELQSRDYFAKHTSKSFI